MRQATRGGIIAVVFLLTACGGQSQMSGSEKADADVELTRYTVSWNTCMFEIEENGSCNEIELERMTGDFIAAVREFRDQGYPEHEMEVRLRDAALEMMAYCTVCVSKLDRERQTL
jgi:hypothetical protein